MSTCLLQEMCRTDCTALALQRARNCALADLAMLLGVRQKRTEGVKRINAEVQHLNPYVPSPFDISSSLP